MRSARCQAREDKLSDRQRLERQPRAEQPSRGLPSALSDEETKTEEDSDEVQAYTSAERLDKFRNELGEQRQLREARSRELVSRVPILYAASVLGN